MEKFELNKLESERPKNIKSEKEKRCYDILDYLGINYERVEYNFFPTESNDLELIDKTLGVRGIKNLIFKSKNNDEFYYVIIFRNEKFDTKKFRKDLNLPKISMATSLDLQNLLNTYSGAVSIMELENDTQNKIRLFIDKKVLESEFFRFHPNENHLTLRIKTSDLINKLLPYLKHNLEIIDCNIKED